MLVTQPGAARSLVWRGQSASHEKMEVSNRNACGLVRVEPTGHDGGQGSHLGPTGTEASKSDLQKEKEHRRSRDERLGSHGEKRRKRESVCLTSLTTCQLPSGPSEGLLQSRHGCQTACGGQTRALPPLRSALLGVYNPHTPFSVGGNCDNF